MLSTLMVLAGLASHALGQANQVTVAKSYTGWDCCKPVCSNGAGRRELLDTRGVVKVCDSGNRAQERDAGLWAESACAGNGGTAYLCQDFQPVPVAEDLSYGFAIQVRRTQNGDDPNCCKCYEVDWLTGNAAGKKMIVQVITPGGSGGDIKENDLIIITPGGGVGPFGDTGCKRQYGSNYDWGTSFGGHTGRGGCERLPSNLQGGCYWRFNWARGDLNGWDIAYRQVSCPSRLTQISGCETRL